MRSVTAILLILIVVIAGVGLYFRFGSKIANNIPSQSNPENTATPTSGITFPVGGETLIKGNTYTLTWNGGADEISIFLVDTALESQGESVSLADRVYGVKNTHSYEYKIPENIPDGQYKFEIGDMTSGVFTISAVAGEESVASLCSASDLKATASFEPAAGTVYGTFKLLNTSGKQCVLKGDNHVQLSYDSSIQNIKANLAQGSETASFTLSPNEAVYATSRVPNGPQCSSQVKQISVGYSYKLSSGQKVTFADSIGNSSFVINGCSAQSDITNVDLSVLSKTAPN